MKVLYVNSLNVGVSYWRLENYASEMVRLKVPVFVEYLFDPRLGYAWDKLCYGTGEISENIRTKLDRAFNHFDVIIFQKVQNKEGVYLIQSLKEKYPSVAVIAEIDDSLGDITPSNFREMKHEGTWAAEHCHISDGIICSTQHLSDSVEALNDNRFVAPNCINIETWSPEIHEDKDPSAPFRFVYVGGGGHDEDLEIIREPMLRFLSENSNVEFVVRYGGYELDWMRGNPQIDFKSVNWCLDEYPQRRADLRADVSLSPLRDSNFNRSKSALKWIEWGSIGVPLLASDVGPYKGLPYSVLCSNSDDAWYEGINLSFNKPRNSAQLKESVFERFNLHENTKALIEWLTVLCNNKKISETDSHNELKSPFIFL